MIGVIGAGAFGTALAITIAEAGQPVVLWARSATHAQDLRKNRRNSVYLHNTRLPDLVIPTSTIEDLSNAQTLLLAVPLQQVRSVLKATKPPVRSIVACCKGIELSTGLGPTGVIKDALPDAETAILTGPSFAADIAVGRPTALTLACEDDTRGEAFQTLLTTPTLRLYRTTDTIGAELGGALKNVMAIACGAVMGADLGNSARAAIMTRGFAEMQRIGAVFGARQETLSGLSGLGDLALTCTSEMSRNYRLGLCLGRNEAFDPSVTVEGAATARAMSEIAQRKGIDVPITETVTELLDGTIAISEAIAKLMTRPLKEE